MAAEIALHPPNDDRGREILDELEEQTEMKPTEVLDDGSRRYYLSAFVLLEEEQGREDEEHEDEVEREKEEREEEQHEAEDEEQEMEYDRALQV